MKQVTAFCKTVRSGTGRDQGDAYAKAFIVQINQGEPMPTVSEMGQLWSIHVNNIRSMWSGEQTPEEAAKNMVAQLEEAVELMNSGK